MLLHLCPRMFVEFFGCIAVLSYLFDILNSWLMFYLTTTSEPQTIYSSPIASNLFHFHSSHESLQAFLSTLYVLYNNIGSTYPTNN